MADKTNLGGVEFSDISGGHIQTGDITTNITAGGDVIGRDQIINNITQIKERVLTAAEEADRAKAIARQRLAEAVTVYVERIGEIAADDQDALQGGPYRGLKAYTLHEAEIFFGRDEAMATLLSHLQRGRLTILHAESGAGKSSLLQAGIQYQLIVQGHVPLYIRPYDKSPTLAIKQALLPGLDSLPELANASLRDYLHQVTSVLGAQTILVILVDQFEEFFFNLNETVRQTFVSELAECLEDESLDVRWVLALRAEFFGNMANFRPRIRTPFENDFRLNRLPSEQARTVIEEPARRLGIDYEPVLIDTLLEDLRDPDSGEVTPAQLQLVCLALYHLLQEQQQQDPDLPATITLKMYEAEGRTEGILRGHLNRVLRRTLNPREREAARQLLIALVSSDQRRIRRTKSDLAATLATYLTAAMSLDGLLDQLVESRLLNVEEDEQSDEPAYELAHDYLLTEIEINPETQARKAAEELLKQEVEAFKRYDTLLSADKFDIINSQREFLTLDHDAAELLRLSQEARNRARIQRIGAIAVAVFLIVGAAVAIAIIQSWAAEEQELLAEEAQRAEATAQSEAVRAVNAESTTQAEAAKALNAEATAQAEAIRALEAKAVAQEQATIALNAEATAIAEKNLAKIERDRANRQTQLANAREIVAVGLNILPENPQTALLLALEAELRSSPALAQPIKSKAPYFFSPIVATWQGHTSDLLAIAYSPDGTQLASASGDGQIIIWDTATNKPVTSFQQTPETRAFKVSWSPDGKKLASTAGRNVIIREIGLNKAFELGPFSTTVHAVAWSPDGKTLVTSVADRTIVLWDLTITPPVSSTILTGHESYIWELAWSPNASVLASASADNRAILWKISNTAVISIPLTGHNDEVNSVAWNPSGTELASGSDDRTIIIWDAETGEQLEQLEGHIDPVNSVIWSHDGQKLISGSSDHTVRVWDRTTGDVEQILREHEGIVRQIALHPQVDLIASISNAESQPLINIWDISNPPNLLLDLHTASVLGAEWRDNDTFATAALDDKVIVWNRNSIDTPQILEGHKHWVLDVAWNPVDNNLLASASWDDTINIWDVVQAKPTTKKGDGTKFWSVAWSPDGQQIAAGSGDTKIVIWDLDKTDPIITLQGHAAGRVLDVNWSPDGKYLASGADDNQIIIWDTATWEPIEHLSQTSDVFAVVWSNDGHRLATGSADGVVTIWDTETWSDQVVFTEHKDAVYDVAWNSDDSLLASASGDATTIVYDVEDKKVLTTLQGHSDSVWAVGWSFDDKTLLSASNDKTIRLLDTRFFEEPCSWLTRNLTFEEWESYLPPSTPYNRTCKNLPVSETVVEAARDLARAGNIEEAISQFKYILTLEPERNFDPVEEANQALQEVIQSHLDEAETLAREGKIEDAIASFRKAKQLDSTLTLDPTTEAQRLAQPTFDNALDAAVDSAGQEDDEAAKTNFEKAMQLAANLNSAEVWHRLCVEGGRWQQAAVVEAACDNAIELEPENGQYYNSRGIVRMQLGNAAGARKDFAEFEEWLEGR